MSFYGVTLQRSDYLQLPASARAASEDDFATWCAAVTARRIPLAIDLFSGAGGLSLGIENAGWKVAAAVDHDDRAIETHRHNFDGLALSLDLSKKEERDQLVKLLAPVGIDLVAGGPPCQPFSRAGRSKIRSLVRDGKRDAKDERRELWRDFLDTAVALKPRAILMENVPDMALGDDLRVVRIIVAELEAAGYAAQVNLVDAWRYGVPQHRKRLILLARNDGGGFAWPAHATRGPTLGDAISDLPPLGETTGGRELKYVETAGLSSFAKRMRRGAKTHVIHDHMTRPVRDDDRTIFNMMTARTLYSDIPAHLRRYTTETFDDKYKRLATDELSRSITAHIAKDGYWYIHPTEPRTLSVREAARVQTFPDRFRFAGTRSDAFRQIGNAVPPLLGAAAATALAVSPASRRTPQPATYTAAREALTAWARDQQRTDHWYLFPGPRVGTATAAAAAVLSGARLRPEVVGQALQYLRGLHKPTTDALRSVKAELTTEPARRALQRLYPLCRKQLIWQEPEQVPAAAQMRPAEASLYRLLMGSDNFLLSAPAFRVASKVTGTKSLEVNRLTDGRLDVARLVGSGPEAGLRMAALRLLGSTICTAKPKCSACPLASTCANPQSATRLNDTRIPPAARTHRHHV